MASSGKKQYVSKTCLSNFNEAQDLLLCKAWSVTMTDPKVSIGQKLDPFWMKVQKYWSRHKRTDYPIRTPVELMQRFALIKTAIDKFCGYYTQVRHFSSQMGIDKVTLAKEMYSELEEMENTGKRGQQKPTFNFEHCWHVLKYEQLWIMAISDELKGSNGTANTSFNGNSRRGVYNASSKLVMAKKPVDRQLAKEGGTKRKGEYANDSALSHKRIEQFHDRIPLHKEGEKASSDDICQGSRPLERKATNAVQATLKGGSQNPIVVD